MSKFALFTKPIATPCYTETKLDDTFWRGLSNGNTTSWDGSQWVGTGGVEIEVINTWAVDYRPTYVVVTTDYEYEIEEADTVSVYDSGLNLIGTTTGDDYQTREFIITLDFSNGLDVFQILTENQGGPDSYVTNIVFSNCDVPDPGPGPPV